MQVKLHVGVCTLSGVGIDLPVEMERTTLGECHDDNRNIGGCMENPKGLDGDCDPTQTAQEVRVEEQEYGAGKPKEGRVQQPGDESENAACFNTEQLCRGEVLEVPHEGVVGRSIHEQIMVNDDACGNDSDAEDGKPVRHIQFDAIEAGNEEARKDDTERKTRADPSGKTGIAACDHGETASVGRSGKRFRL